MLRQFAFYSSRLHIITVFLLIVVCLPALSLLPPVSINTPAISATKEQSRRSAYVDDGPNVVSAGLAAGIAELRQSVDAAGAKTARVLYVAALTSYDALRTVGKISAHYGGVAARAAGTGIARIAHGLVDVTVFIVRMPVKMIGAVTNMPVVNAYVRPAEDMTVPEIDYATAIAAAEESKLAKQQTGAEKEAKHKHDDSPKESASLWPIHGQVTTLFGVPHWPFQPTHTGMDISSGNASGVMPIKPFRPGMVIEVVHSDYGLGNYVIVDHGEGLTSVYAHLASISVRAGQEVTASTVLGHEGSTGASTGTHLHFEIRQNGQPVNPQQYINVHP